MVSEVVMRARRQQRLQRIDARIQWFINRVTQGVHIGMRTRMRFAAQLLRDKIVFNISVPVRKEVLRRQARNPETGRMQSVSRTRVTQRSQPGEFPRADTTRLMKDIFFDVRDEQTVIRAIVGTTLDYGLVLEARRNRSFLRRTMEEELPLIRSVLVGARGRMIRFPGDDAVN